MKDGQKPHGSQRPGGRTAAIGKRVTQYALDQLRHGNSDFSVADIAAQTGIHRSTIYRRWPSKEALLLEVIQLHTSSITIPDSGNWHNDLRQLCDSFARFAVDPVELAILRLMVQPESTELASLIMQQWQPLLQQQAAPIQAAKARGEINPAINSRGLLSMILSPLVIQSLISDGKIDDDFINALCETITQLTAAPAEQE